MNPFTRLIIITVVTAAMSGCASPAHVGRINIVSISNLTDISDSGTDVCRSFQLDKADAATYFKLATKVDSLEFSSDAVVLPCKYGGELTKNGRRSSWVIHAGGAGYLYDREGKLLERYVCVDACCSRLGGVC